MRGMPCLAVGVVGACLLAAGCGPLAALTSAEVAASIPAAAAPPLRSTENLGSAMLQLACDHALGARWRLIARAQVQPAPAGAQSVFYRIHGVAFAFERTRGGRSGIVPQGTNAGAALLLASGAFALPAAYCQDIFPRPAQRTTFLALAGALASCHRPGRPALPCRALGVASAAVRGLRAELGKLG